MKTEEKLKIKIPRGLASALANHRGYTRVIAAFCQLKALESSSRFSSWRKQINEMSDACKISSRTLETRISEMKLAGLAKTEGGDLILCSWDFVWTKFNIQFKTKKYWYYDAEKITCKLEYLFQFLALKEVQLNMMQAYRMRVKDRPDYEYELKSILGVDQQQPITAQAHLAGVLQSFCQGGFTELEVNMLSYLNPDDQVSCRYMQKLFGYSDSSLSGPSYRKKILAKMGIITVEKRAFESTVRARKGNSGTINYSRRKNQTFLRLCDRICPAF